MLASIGAKGGRRTLLSKNLVDTKIGERLRTGDIDADVLRLLEEYRSEFEEAYAHVEHILTSKLYCNVTGRPSKSTLAITEKLRRQHSRLSQIQDIAGCRVVVPTMDDQDDIIAQAKAWFPNIVVDDKRERLNGYRAVHLIVTHKGKQVEVQVRTNAQHFWAEISEKLADHFGQELKYGNGKQEALDFLSEFAAETVTLEKLQNQKIALLKETPSLAQRKAAKRRIESLDSARRHSMYRAKALFMKLDKAASE